MEHLKDSNKCGVVLLLVAALPEDGADLLQRLVLGLWDLEVREGGEETEEDDEDDKD